MTNQDQHSETLRELLRQDYCANECSNFACLANPNHSREKPIVHFCPHNLAYVKRTMALLKEAGVGWVRYYPLRETSNHPHGGIKCEFIPIEMLKGDRK